MKMNYTQAVLDLMTNPLASGVQHIAVEHDIGCPLSSSSGSHGECTCEEVNVRISTEDEYMQIINRTRSMRRKAKREADKAMRKARQKGGAK